MTPQPVRHAPRLDRLIVVTGHQDDLFGRHPIQPALELAGEKCVLGRAGALEGKRHVAGDQQQIARGDIDEMLVEVGHANDRRHPRARIVCVPDAEDRRRDAERSTPGRLEEAVRLSRLASELEENLRREPPSVWPPCCGTPLGLRDDALMNKTRVVVNEQRRPRDDVRMPTEGARGAAKIPGRSKEMARAVAEWTDARLNDLAATLEPVPSQLAMLSASVTHFEHVATQLESVPSQLAVLASSVERLTDDNRALRAELAAAQLQLLQVSWGLVAALIGAAAAVASALI